MFDSQRSTLPSDDSRGGGRRWGLFFPSRGQVWSNNWDGIPGVFQFIIITIIITIMSSSPITNNSIRMEIAPLSFAFAWPITMKIAWSASRHSLICDFIVKILGIYNYCWNSQSCRHKVTFISWEALISKSFLELTFYCWANKNAWRFSDFTSPPLYLVLKPLSVSQVTSSSAATGKNDIVTRIYSPPPTLRYL